MLDWRSAETAFARLAFKAGGHNRRRIYRRLAKYIGNGVPILAAIEEMRNWKIAAAGRSHPESIAFDAWAAGIRNGHTIADAVAPWVAPEERMLLAAGEASGTMDTALQSAADITQARAAIRGAVIGGLAYPFFLVLVAFGALWLFGFKIVPSFNTIVKGVGAWHGLARAMVETSLFAREWLWALALAFVVLVVAFFTSLRYWDGPVRAKLDQYLPYSIYRIVHGSTWLIALSALVGAGIKIESALESLARDAQPWLKSRVNAALAGMRSGFNLGDSLARAGHSFPDQDIIADLGVYARFSGFDAALGVLGREWIEEAVQQIKLRMWLLFGVGILVVGLFIAFMVAGLMAMNLQMSQVMQQSFR